MSIIVSQCSQSEMSLHTDVHMHAQVGSSCSGKSSVVQVLAQLCGRKLVEFPMNTDTDTTELLGGFQQVRTNIYVCNFHVRNLHFLYEWYICYYTQINFGRQCANIASLLVDMSNCLMTELSYRGDSGEYTEELRAVVSTLRKVQSPLCKLYRSSDCM